MLLILFIHFPSLSFLLSIYWCWVPEKTEERERKEREEEEEEEEDSFDCNVEKWKGVKLVWASVLNLAEFRQKDSVNLHMK